MQKIQIKYATYANAQPPQPIRFTKPGWAGTAERMIDGSEPQPWHCLPFVEGNTYGLELVYQYETECQVFNDNGTLRFEWDYAKEPGGVVSGGEFSAFEPKNNSKFYLFNARLDLQLPPGYVIRTEPHPRFFTDDTGTVPLAMIGHVQAEWWARKLFVVFRSPPRGGRHVFRKGEPYVQLLFVPTRVAYDLVRMEPQEEERRRTLEDSVDRARNEISENVWRNPAGAIFSDHYKVLARAFARDGLEGVVEHVRGAEQRREQGLPREKPIGECLAMAQQKLDERDFVAARELYTHVLNRDPNNAEAMSQLGVVAVCVGQPVDGLKLMSQATLLQPGIAKYHSNFGELLRMSGRFAEAEASFRTALRLTPTDGVLLSVLGLTVAQQGRADEGMELCRRAAALAPSAAAVHYRKGLVHAQRREFAEARASYEEALRSDPGFHHARNALAQLSSAGAGT